MRLQVLLDVWSDIDRIYKQNTRFTKDPIAYTLGVPNAISMLFDISEHKKRRETLNPSFSKRRILLLEDLMYEELEKVMSYAMPYIERKEPLPIQDAYYCFTVSIHDHYPIHVDCRGVSLMIPRLMLSLTSRLEKALT